MIRMTFARHWGSTPRVRCTEGARTRGRPGLRVVGVQVGWLLAITLVGTCLLLWLTGQALVRFAQLAAS